MKRRTKNDNLRPHDSEDGAYNLKESISNKISPLKFFCLCSYKNDQITPPIANKVVKACRGAKKDLHEHVQNITNTKQGRTPNQSAGSIRWLCED